MPRVKMTPVVRFALYFLRIYLIFLLTLLLVRFLRIFHCTTLASKAGCCTHLRLRAIPCASLLWIAWWRDTRRESRPGGPFGAATVSSDLWGSDY